MPYISHRYSAMRNFDCVFDPTYTLPSERDKKQARSSALSRSTPTKIFPKYNVMFSAEPKAKRMTVRKQSCNIPYVLAEETLSTNSIIQKENTSSAKHPRYSGGANKTAELKSGHAVISSSDCKRKAPGLHYFKPNTNINVVNVKLHQIPKKTTESCGLLRLPTSLNKTRSTQTLYRESSAQTLPYLPDVRNNNNTDLNKLEIYKLSKILPNLNKPPGLHEVQILERARKRWALLEKVKSEKLSKGDNPPQHILEAVEWENWIEREESLQECQALRFEMLTAMFNEREKEMHDASCLRLEMASQNIGAKRNAKLRKNDIEYWRELRRLEADYRWETRNWRKENIINAFGDPSSDYFAPLTRYGVNPNRRQFTPARRAFEAHIKSLGKQTLNVKDLVCPYAKLNKWSKPKERLMEVEQNFCKDTNLKNLYEVLRGLREQYGKHKETPRCLIKKIVTRPLTTLLHEHPSTENNISQKITENDWIREPTEEIRRGYEELHKMSVIEKRRTMYLFDQRKEEEWEVLLRSFEGKTIGWTMRFLSEEMQRLFEQRRVQYLAILAHKERFHREAAEAGLRQKENEMRKFLECMYNATYPANKEMSALYLDNITDFEIEVYSEDIARAKIVEWSKVIDEDIQCWLDRIGSIQTPKNYDELRCMLREIIYPNILKLKTRFESKVIVKHVLADILRYVFTVREPHDVSNAIRDETVSRAIDDDLYFFSTDSEDDTDHENTLPQIEAKAILRKLIRRSVPGRRWKTPEERICIENVTSLVGDVIDSLAKRKDTVVKQCARMDLTCSHHLNLPDTESEVDIELVTKIIKLQGKWNDSDKGKQKLSIYEPGPVKSIPSALNVFDNKQKKGGNDTSGDYRLSSAELSNIGIIFDAIQLACIDREGVQQFLGDILREVVDNAVKSDVMNEWINENFESEENLRTYTPLDSIQTFSYDGSTEEVVIFNSSDDFSKIFKEEEEEEQLGSQQSTDSKDLLDTKMVAANPKPKEKRKQIKENLGHEDYNLTNMELNVEISQGDTAEKVGHVEKKIIAIEKVKELAENGNAVNEVLKKELQEEKKIDGEFGEIHELEKQAKTAGQNILSERLESKTPDGESKKTKSLIVDLTIDSVTPGVVNGKTSTTPARMDSISVSKR